MIAVAVRGLPHAFRDLLAEPGQTIAIDVSGASGSEWTLTREPDRWSLSGGQPLEPTIAHPPQRRHGVETPVQRAARGEAARLIRIDGQTGLAAPLLRARSVIV